MNSRRVKRKNHTDDAETAEQVLDKRTRLMLYKLVNNRTLESVDGIIATGKVCVRGACGVIMERCLFVYAGSAGGAFCVLKPANGALMSHKLCCLICI